MGVKGIERLECITEELLERKLVVYFVLRKRLFRK